MDLSHFSLLLLFVFNGKHFEGLISKSVQGSISLSCFPSPLPSGWCHLLQLLGLTHLLALQPPIKHSHHRQRACSYLGIQSCLLLLITHQQLLLLLECMLEVLASPCLLHYVAGSIYIINICAHQDFSMCCSVCLEHLSRHIFLNFTYLFIFTSDQVPTLHPSYQTSHKSWGLEDTVGVRSGIWHPVWFSVCLQN